jgi:MtN3 and saliva related transmembrane protein
LVEQRIENPRVVGSIPTPATIFSRPVPRNMNTEWLGFAAAALTTGSFIPQALMTIRTRNTSGVSLGMYVVFTVGVAIWLLYGLALNSWPMIIANTITLVLAAIILGFKLKYR